MRINPRIPNFREKDYKQKLSPEQVLIELRSRYEYETLRKNSWKNWFYRKLPTKEMKIHIGPIVPFIPRYEWDKLKYRYGRMSGVKRNKRLDT